MKGTVHVQKRNLAEKDERPRYRYYVVAKVGGQRFAHGGFSSVRDAERRKRQIEVELAGGTYGKVVEEITFRKYAQMFLDDHRASIKESTFIAYGYDFKNHLIPYFGKKLLSNIMREDVKSFKALELKQGLSPRTVGKTLTVLRLMFKHATIDGYIDADPARFVPNPKVPQKKMLCLRLDEVEKLIEYSPPDYKALFATAVLTGARQGELLALRWGDLDLDGGYMYISQTFHPRTGETPPKSSSANRAVPLPPKLVDILFAHQQFTGGDPDALVFAGPDGGHMSAAHMVRDHFHPTLKDLGIRRVRFHDLRHTYAAMRIAAKNLNVKKLQEHMGHSSIKTTLDTYGHLMKDVKDDTGEELDALVFGRK